LKRTMENNTITIAARVHAPAEYAWECYTRPEHIIHWNFASPDWHCPAAKSDLKPGGKFAYTMASRDGKASFDFEGVFNELIPGQLLRYSIADGRAVEVYFIEEPDITLVRIKFEAENFHTIEQQRDGWQSILNEFVRYTEALYNAR